jgi:hypothetical protein
VILCLQTAFAALLNSLIGNLQRQIPISCTSRKSEAEMRVKVKLVL